MKKLIPLSILIAALATAHSAQAQEIGVAFTAGGTGLYEYSGSITGEVAFNTNYWNQVSATSASALELVDSTDADSLANLTFSASTAGGGNSNAGGNINNLLAGGIYLYGGTVTLSLSSIPYSSYDVYVYVGNSGDSGHTATGTLTGSYTESLEYQPLGGHENAFITNSDPSASYPVADTLVFDGLTGSSFTYSQYTGTPGNSTDINGIEIVNTGAAPEPSTWAMMCAGLAFLGLCIRRRGASRV